MSKNYRYHLLKYHGKASRLTCPQCGRPHCFTPYVDDDENIVGEEFDRATEEGDIAARIERNVTEWLKTR